VGESSPAFFYGPAFLTSASEGGIKMDGRVKPAHGAGELLDLLSRYCAPDARGAKAANLKAV
jgi:hypothetical protein